jgi:hypothetical protein
MKQLLLTFYTLTAFLFSLQAQDVCGIDHFMNGTDAQDYYLELNDRVDNYLLSQDHQDRSSITIPVVFHIVYNTTEQNINDSLILQTIATLR